MLHRYMELDCHFSLWNASYICCDTKGRGMRCSTEMKAGRISKRFFLGMEEDCWGWRKLVQEGEEEIDAARNRFA